MIEIRKMGCIIIMVLCSHWSLGVTVKRTPDSADLHGCCLYVWRLWSDTTNQAARSRTIYCTQKFQNLFNMSLHCRITIDCIPWYQDSHFFYEYLLKKTKKKHCFVAIFVYCLFQDIMESLACDPILFFIRKFCGTSPWRPFGCPMKSYLRSKTFGTINRWPYILGERTTVFPTSK